MEQATVIDSQNQDLHRLIKDNITGFCQYQEANRPGATGGHTGAMSPQLAACAPPKQKLCPPKRGLCP